jgi:hypothetical protein
MFDKMRSSARKGKRWQSEMRHPPTGMKNLDRQGTRAVQLRQVLHGLELPEHLAVVAHQQERRAVLGARLTDEGEGGARWPTARNLSSPTNRPATSTA